MPHPRRQHDVDGPKTRDMGEFSARQQGSTRRVGRSCGRAERGGDAGAAGSAWALTTQAIHERVARGRLHRIHQRVYSLTPRVMTERGRFMAAVLACGPGAVLSHRSAAYLWGLVDEWEEPIDVTAPNRRGRSPDGVAAHRDGSLQPIDKTTLHGIPCTSVARTLLDFAGVAPEWEVRKAVAQAEVLRLLDRRDVASAPEAQSSEARRRSASPDPRHDPSADEEDAQRARATVPRHVHAARGPPTRGQRLARRPRTASATRPTSSGAKRG